MKIIDWNYVYLLLGLDMDVYEKTQKDSTFVDDEENECILDEP